MASRGSKTTGGDQVQTSTARGAAQVGPISVEIRGQRLSIRSDRDPAFVEALASYIDKKVAELQSAAPSAPFDKLLMLAGMSVAEELFETQGELDDLKRQLRERAASMASLLDECDSL